MLFLISLCFHRQDVSVFAILLEKIERADVKLDAQNEPGVFLGFCHPENTFGAIILVKQSLVVARHNVALIENVFPFKEKKPSFTHWESLHKLIGRKNAEIEVHDFLTIFCLTYILTSSLLLLHKRNKRSLSFQLHAHLMSLQSTFHLMMKKLKTF